MAAAPSHEHDWASVVARYARTAGVDLSPQTIDELATHLEELYLAARVGVMPAGFHFPDGVDVWERLQWDLSQHSRSAHFMEGVARLADGTSLEQARAACDSLAIRLA